MSDRLALAVAELVDALREEIEPAEPDRPLPDRLLSIPEAATLLGVGRTLAYDLIGRGDLRSVKVGRRRLVPAGAVRAYLGGEP
jgi:excisionase family DNA binding protein